MARRPDFGGEKFFSREDLKAMARSMSFLSESAIRDIYQRAYRDCQIRQKQDSHSSRCPGVGTGLEAAAEMAPVKN
jgi:hypothetical protein